MAEIKDLEKNVAEGELTDEALDVSGGVGCHASYSEDTFFHVDPAKPAVFGVDFAQPAILAVDDKSENC
jgi:hypothetical protein